MAATDQRKIGSGFGAKSEPEEVLAGIDLSGRTALVTGGYSGIGLETTRALAGAGARVLVPARSMEKARSALDTLREDLDLDDDAIVLDEMDLADLGQVRSYAAGVAKEVDALDLLINNAGVMACPETRVGDGWELQFAVNHIGHFVLTGELMPLLRSAAEARSGSENTVLPSTPRVVALTSTGHKLSDIRWDDIHFERDPYDKWQAYGQSKTANALFALGFDLRNRDEGIRAFSVHPGGILTDLQRHMDTEEMAALGWTDEEGNLTDEARALFKTPSQGASTTLWAATSPDLDGRGGLYLADCEVAEPAGPDTPRYEGVAPYAVDDNSALRLWEVTEEMVAEA